MIDNCNLILRTDEDVHTQIRPAFQLSGTEKDTEVPGGASQLGGHKHNSVSCDDDHTHPVGWSGTAEATFKSVNNCGGHKVKLMQG